MTALLAINIHTGNTRVKGVFTSVNAALAACKMPPDRVEVEGPRLDRALRTCGVADFEWRGKEFSLRNAHHTDDD